MCLSSGKLEKETVFFLVRLLVSFIRLDLLGNGVFVSFEVEVSASDDTDPFSSTTGSMAYKIPCILSFIIIPWTSQYTEEEVYR